MRCASCGLDGNSGPRCDRCGALLARAPAPIPVAVQPQAIAAPAPRATPQPWPPRELLAIPLALLASMIVVATGPGRFLVSASAEMELHELGHATALWLAGRGAIPLPMFTLEPSEGRSVIAFVLVALALAFTARTALREELTALLAICAALGLALLGCTALLSGERLDLWVKFAGAGGELWLGALLVIAFHHRMPAAWRWTQARWFFLGWGALSFAAAAARWWRGEIPWGSFWGGDGDMDTLSQHGWSDASIIHAYRTVLVLCALAIAVELGARAWASRPRG